MIFLEFYLFDGVTLNHFGYSVAVSDMTVVVGAYQDDDRVGNSGSAYIFDTNTGAQLFKLTASDGYQYNQFGWSVAVSDATAIFGVYCSGSAYIFDTNTGAQLFKLTLFDWAAYGTFGQSVAVSGATAIVGAYGDDYRDTDTGSVYIFYQVPT